jgi:hypothetical protein
MRGIRISAAIVPQLIDRAFEVELELLPRLLRLNAGAEEPPERSARSHDALASGASSTLNTASAYDVQLRVAARSSPLPCSVNS